MMSRKTLLVKCFASGAPLGNIWSIDSCLQGRRKTRSCSHRGEALTTADSFRSSFSVVSEKSDTRISVGVSKCGRRLCRRCCCRRRKEKSESCRRRRRRKAKGLVES